MKNKTKNNKSMFWMLNLMQIIEKFCYWSVLIQLPIYIAQKGDNAGLQWDQTDKGILFFCWAAVQNTIPIIAGMYVYKYGYRKMFLTSFILIEIGYLLIATQKNFAGLMVAFIVLGLGSGIFKPTMQGNVASVIDKKQIKQGWSIYFMLLNIAVFLAPPFSKYLKHIDYFWVFAGSAAVFLLNFILLSIMKPNYEKDGNPVNFLQLLKIIKKSLFGTKIYYFIIFLSGFTIIYMQFYETLPNFIIDWSSTTEIAQSLNLPDFMMSETGRGEMISYEWLYNLNAALVVLFVVPVGLVFKRFKVLTGIMFGILLAAAGLMLCGMGIDGKYLIFGIFIYTFGELITNPKFTEYLGNASSESEKPIYLSFLNISFAIGLSCGSLLGSYLYKHLAEKSHLAMEFLRYNYNIIDGITPQNAFANLMKHSGKDAVQATEMLWNYYNPSIVWLPFIAIGIISVLGLFFYNKIND